MNVLITGATGFIGSHVAESLHLKGYQLRCLVRRTSNLQWIRNLPVEYVYGDLFDAEVLSAAVKEVDFIYHIAGTTKAKKRDEYFRGNHLATQNLLDAVLRINPGVKRFVHVSSQAAVGPDLNHHPIDEQTPFHPITAYGVSKMEAEKDCLKVMDKLPITIVRPPTVYGPRDTDVFKFFKTISQGLQPMIGFGKKHVNLIHVKDLVDGIILAGEHPKGAGQTYFISSERVYDWEEIGNLTAKIMNKKTMTVRIPEFIVYAVFAVPEIFSLFSSKPSILNIEKAKDVIQKAWTCDIAKARTELGYREKMSLEDGIRSTVEWYRKMNWLK